MARNCSVAHRPGPSIFKLQRSSSEWTGVRANHKTPLAIFEQRPLLMLLHTHTTRTTITIYTNRKARDEHATRPSSLQLIGARETIRGGQRIRSERPRRSTLWDSKQWGAAASSPPSSPPRSLLSPPRAPRRTASATSSTSSGPATSTTTSATRTRGSRMRRSTWCPGPATSRASPRRR